MYRLLIVDDEPAIVEGLVQIFKEREEFDLDICKACSAFEAIEILRKTKIDIVISDIRMPEKNGLQMMEEIIFYWPSCRIIFLTGYDEFEYVYTAIQNNVENYILKTEEESVLIEAVENVIHKIDEELRSKDIIFKAQNQMKLMAPLINKEILEAVLLGENIEEVFSETLYQRKEFNLNMKAPVLMIVGRIDEWEEEIDYVSKLKILYSIRNIVQEGLLASLKSEDVIHENSMIIWFIQLDEGAEKFILEDGKTDWESLSSYLKSALEAVQNQCFDLLHKQISFIISKGAVNWENIHKEFEMIKITLRKRALSCQKMSVVDMSKESELAMMDASKKIDYSEEFNKKLRILEKNLNSGLEKQSKDICVELIATLKNDINKNYFLGMERYYRFINTFLATISNIVTISNQSDLYDIRDEKYVQVFEIVESPKHWNVTEEYFMEIIKNICEQKKEQVANGENMLVERIHLFINENLDGDLSLARIAEAVYFNPSYLSRYYKQLTGRNLSEYIDSVKAEEAVNMLHDMQLKINKIALKLGFESPSYFTAFFRKMKGVSPQEYRENIINHM